MGKKRVFLFLDGLGETKFPTSLSLARHPHIDLLASNGTVGFFNPILLDGQTSPKTDVNIPFFFGQEPQHFPGRAALEMADMGFVPQENWWTGEIRIGVHDDQLIPQSWITEEAKTGHFLNTCIELIGRYSKADCQLLLSPFASHKNKILAHAESRQTLMRILLEMNSAFSPQGYYLSAESVFKYSAPRHFQRKVFFGGWAHGALRGFFKLAGATVNENHPTIFDLAARQQDFDEFIYEQSHSAFSYYDDIVFYIKETDKASHLDRRDLKIEAIEFADGLLSEIIRTAPTQITFALISDHPTDLGDLQSKNAPSPFLICSDRCFDLLNTSPPHFCEETIMSLGSTLEASRLRDMLNSSK